MLGQEGVTPLRSELGVTGRNGGFIGCSPMVQAGPVINRHTGQVDPTKSDCTKRFPGLVSGFGPRS